MTLRVYPHCVAAVRASAWLSAAHISLIQEDEIFSFGDVFDPSSASLALSRKVVGIEDMVLRVQRRDCMEAPVNVWLVLFVERDDSMISSF